MTSVPPTQPPDVIIHDAGCSWETGPDCNCGADPERISAAPETDVRLREALHRAFHDHWGGPNEPLNLYADSPLWQKQAEAVERIVAERVRVVEGERDAALEAVAWWVDKWAELRTVLAVVADRVDEFTYDEFASILDDAPCDHEGEPYTNTRAESAEAAHAALVAAVEALASKTKREADEEWTAHSEAADMGDLDAANLHGAVAEARDEHHSRLRALLAGGAR